MRLPKSIAFNGVSSAESFVKKMSIEHELDIIRKNGSIKGDPQWMSIFEKYSLTGKNIALFDKGREIGERSFILVKNGQLVGYGYAELNHQMNNIHILESLLTPMESDDNTTFIIESYLRKKHRLKILELTTTV